MTGTVGSESLAVLMEADRRRFIAQYTVSRETLLDLETYVNLLKKWQAAINLVGPATIQEIWTRHILDSIQVVDLAPNATRWVDLGSGAGLPGAVISIALKNRPGASVFLIESNGKKAGFLQHVVQATAAPAKVLSGRIEDLLPRLHGIDIITARALAPLSKLLDWSEPLLKSGAACLFHKGRDLDKELMDAARYWDLEYDAIPSVVASRSWILRIRTARRLSDGEQR